MIRKRDIIIISEGGCMSGIFGAGVFSAFQTFGLGKRVDSIYAASAGAGNAACFIGGDTFEGSSVYYQDLIDNKFIKKDKLSEYFYEIYEHLVSKEKKIESIVDVDYFINILKNQKKISPDRVAKSDINFYIRVLNLDTLSFEYLHAKKDVLKDVQASCAVAPFYTKTITIKGKRYIDGELIPNKEFLNIIKANPKKKIIYIINQKHSFWKKLFGLGFASIQGLLLGIVYGWKLAGKVIYHYGQTVTEQDIKDFPNVYPIINKHHIDTDCTQEKKLLKVYVHGMMEGIKCLKKTGIPLDG